MENPAVTSLCSRQAIEWFVRGRDEDLPRTERSEFLRWIKQSPAHIAEMLNICKLFGDCRRLALDRLCDENSTALFTPWVIAEMIEREEIKSVRRWLRESKRCDIALWVRASVPMGRRVTAALGQQVSLPETTLRSLAQEELDRRAKIEERIWSILRIVLSGVVSALFKFFTLRR